MTSAVSLWVFVGFCGFIIWHTEAWEKGYEMRRIYWVLLWVIMMVLGPVSFFISAAIDIVKFKPMKRVLKKGR